MSRHVAAAAVPTAATAGPGVVAFLLLALPGSPWPWLGYAAAVLAVGAGWAGNRPPPLGTDVPVRTLLAAGVLAHATGQGYSTAALAVTGVGLLGALLSEPLLYRLARPWYRAVRLVHPRVPAVLVDNGTAWGVASVAVLLAGLVTLLAGPGWLLAAPAVAAAGFAGWLLADGGYRWRAGHRGELARLRRAVEAHQPRFLVYFSAPPGSAYQVRMWLPYLSRLGEPFLVVLAERENLAAVAPAAAATGGVPVVACDTFESLDAVLDAPSLRMACYVNNAAKNAHCVRVTRLTHVQLYHGDSDKAVTASPLNQLYDRVFVAGQAAVDRFAAHGVEIPADRLRIVGRPQVAELAVAHLPIAEVGSPTVLYAPTWVGAHGDSRHCSLPIAEAIVAGLLARGATVVLRPHPYTHRDRASAEQLRRAEQLLARDPAGREHRWGRAASAELSLFACMDLADAMICDVSAVASDFLFTGKPFAITDMAGAGDRFPESFPVARAAYVLHRDAGNLAEVLDDLLGRDPSAPVREQLRTYYLGDFLPERYVDAFLTEARSCLEPTAEPRRVA